MLLGQCLERCSEPSKERLSVFLENVRQEMPQAHLELLHSGSLCMTAEAFGALPAHLVIRCFRAGLSLHGVNLPCVLYVKHDKICFLKITILHKMSVEFLILCVAFRVNVCV